MYFYVCYMGLQGMAAGHTLWSSVTHHPIDDLKVYPVVGFRTFYFYCFLLHCMGWVHFQLQMCCFYDFMHTCILCMCVGCGFLYELYWSGSLTWHFQLRQNVLYRGGGEGDICICCHDTAPICSLHEQWIVVYASKCTYVFMYLHTNLSMYMQAI